MSSVNGKNNGNGLGGREYWRSLQQYSQTDEFEKFLYKEFPAGTSEWSKDNSWSRRSFLATMGASLALAGLTGCRRPVEKIVPFVTRPEEITPGASLQYATTMPFGQDAYGLLVKTVDGRPIKIDGNDLHPSTRGKSHIYTLAQTLSLYDPDRSQVVRKDGQEAAWADFVTFWAERRTALQENGGAGLAILSEEISSPAMSRLYDELQRSFPNATWVAWNPISDENVYAGHRQATGETLEPLRKYDEAKVILSLDADFLKFESESISASVGFGEGRRVMSEQDEMNRLYVVESNYSMTGGMADHRLRLKSSRIGAFLLAVLNELSKRGLSVAGYDSQASEDSFDQKYISALADDLMANRGESLVVAGYRQSPEVHALVYALNEALGNNGSTVSYRVRENRFGSNTAALRNLVGRMQAGDVDTLVMLGGNPIYNTPADVDFAAALRKVPNTVHHSLHVDETSSKVQWHLPATHFLESWGDAEAADGTVSVVQPMIAPLYEGCVGALDLISLLALGEARPAYEVLRVFWEERLGSTNFEEKWRQVLHAGVLDGSAARTVSRRAQANQISNAAGRLRGQQATEGIEVGFYPSHVYDGRFGNNGWLHELADSVTKLTWDNAALMSPATAEQFGLKIGDAVADMIELTVEGRSLTLPVWIVPGHADNAISVMLGYGRTQAGRIGNAVGFDTYRIRSTAGMHVATGAQVTKTGQTHDMANTQDHNTMKGRPIARENTLAGYRAGEELLPEGTDHPPLLPLWEPHSYEEGYQWGMSIDLNTCIGCNACTIACQSENNIPVVGKEQVMKGREMQWIRVDRYFATQPDNDMKAAEEPEMVVQPMPCQHCENAPCEAVCPVNATAHDDEGLNVMVYNRCIGTRYCSNNCPYKVRRFNFFNYTNEYPEVMKMVQNPEVTVRFRGVMEKCTFCLQRISKGKINAKVQGRLLRDGEIKTACQEACPTDAIVFGNINDTDSRVYKLKRNNRRYDVLAELNIKPRTSYLGKLRNPHPDLAPVKPAAGDDHGGEDHG